MIGRGRTGILALFGVVFLGQLFLGTIFVSKIHKLQDEVATMQMVHARDRDKILQLEKETTRRGNDDNNNNNKSGNDSSGRWDNAEEEELLPIQQRSGISNNKGFRPVYVYSNPETARKEIPERTSDTNRDHKVHEPYSQVNQDKIVLALTRANDEKRPPSRQKRKKYFVDLAANHAITLSNTLLLEQNGWTGLCIEGNPEYWYLHARHRRCTIIGAFVGGREDGTQAEIALRGVAGGIVRDDTDNKKKNNNKQTVGHHGQKIVEQRDLVSIETVLRETGVPSAIDYFSLDVEGAESFVMADFPWGEYRFRFLTVERPKKDLEKLLRGNGYKMVRKLVAWGETLWYHEELVYLSKEEMEQIVSSFAQ